MFCPECRAELPDTAKYCVSCGYDFAKLKTPPPSRKASSDPFDDIDTTFGQEIDTSSFEKGSLFANRYEILDEGKKGGMGAVYKCMDTKLHEVVALKIIHSRLLTSKQALQRFRQEVAISRKLNHEGIVKVYNLEEWEGKEYFTMEWVEGVTLREIIKERQVHDRPFSIDEAYEILSQLCDALQYAHSYTVHRDIKPENILVANPPTLTKGSEGGFSIKLTDFGIAKMLTPAQFTTTSMRMGKPDYMAPEQKVDAGNVDKRADIYALGVVLFELLTLDNTVGPEMPSELNKDLPKELDTIYRSAVAKRPENRYRDAKELALALHEITEEGNQRRQAEGQTRQAEEERKKREADQKRQEAEKQRAATEEKTKIETETKNLAAEKERVEREKKRIEEQRKETEAQGVRQEQARREEEARQKQLQEGSQKKSPALMIGVVIIAVIIGIFIYTQQSRTVQTPVAEAPRPEAPTPVPTPAPALAPAPAAVPAPKPTPAPAAVPLPVPQPKAE